MKVSITFRALLTTLLVTAQNKAKIDSIFKRNFYILELELHGSKNFEVDKNIFYNEIILDDGQAIYTSK